MVEKYFAAPWALDRIRSGPMAPYLGALAAELQARDYSSRNIWRQPHNVDSFGWWLKE